MPASPYAQHWSLDPETIFLNHGSFGACPTAVLEAQQEWQRRIERDPVHFFVRLLEPALDQARQRLANFVGADPDCLAFVTNATSGVNTVLRSLDLNAGDQLLTTNHEYNACRNALDFVAKRARAEVVTAHVPFPIRAPEEATNAILDAVTGRTKLALIDHITSPTGLVLPIREIVTALRERGVETLIDGAHGPGHVELELDALGAAYYTGNAHKWLCTPKGAALLYVRDDLRTSLRPLTIGHGANSPRADRSRFRLEFDWPGTADPTPWLCIPHAIDAMAAMVDGGWPAIRKQNHELVLGGRALLLDRLTRHGMSPEAPAPASMIGHLATIALPTEHVPVGASNQETDPLHDVLYDRHRIQVPVFHWPALGMRALRISAQLYNSVEQYVALADALDEELAREGHA
ncbi:MAG: aminotransferase class V-fold PLP-dependent enzyme [Planctomycetes bacterium]|nr:aminotransferase class V-fold PLP-dependent enzyme [Planctomycetota bacterium]